MARYIVESVRKFAATQMELGGGFDRDAWFVFDRKIGTSEWHMHCGPYASFEQAADWIHGIRDTSADAPLKE